MSLTNAEIVALYAPGDWYLEAIGWCDTDTGML